MLTQIIWWVSILLMSTLLVRALQGRYASRYLLFYLYLAWVLASSLICFYTFSTRPASYATVYWHTQFLSLALGYGVIWVVYS
ncbi:MAG: hypothetical protein L0338_01930 [Acidobacteria bacterium]|nr:hypothetical protein [Acidobacteriota bacterium]